MFPPGFLGTRADVLIDIVTLSFVIILPMLVWSWRLARVDWYSRAESSSWSKAARGVESECLP